MSEKLCALKKIGGGTKELTETTLWTNSSPTSNFAYQTVSLSDSMDNYDFLAFYWRISTSNASETHLIIPVSEFKKEDNTLTLTFKSLIGVQYNAATYARLLAYISETQSVLGTAYQLGGSATNNSLIIPTKIIGMKY